MRISNKMRHVMCVSVLILLTCSCLTNAQTAKELRCGWGGQWQPYWIKTETGEFTGFDIDILKAVATDAGFFLSFSEHEIPWARKMYSIENGGLDIASSASKTEQREKFAYFSAPYRHELVGLYFRENDIDNYTLEKIEDLLKYKDIRIGAEIGSKYGARIDSVLAKLGDRVERITDYDVRNREKLMHKRIDCYLGYPIHEALKKNSEGVKQHKMPLINTGNIHFMLSRKTVSEQQFKTFNMSLKKFLQSDGFKNIVQKYKNEYGIEKW